jgi:hypothetical protein
MEKGGLRSMVIEIKQGIPMVQTRFKVKTQHYVGATELPLILVSTRLGFLLCFDAHEQTHWAGDLALTVTKQVAFIVGAKKLLLLIRKTCTICREEHAQPIRKRMGDIPSDQQHPEPGFRKISVDLVGPYLMRADVRRQSGQKDKDDERGKFGLQCLPAACPQQSNCTSAGTIQKKDFFKHGGSTCATGESQVLYFQIEVLSKSAPQ